MAKNRDRHLPIGDLLSEQLARIRRQADAGIYSADKSEILKTLIDLVEAWIGIAARANKKSLRDSSTRQAISTAITLGQTDGNLRLEDLAAAGIASRNSTKNASAKKTERTLSRHAGWRARFILRYPGVPFSEAKIEHAEYIAGWWGSQRDDRKRPNKKPNARVVLRILTGDPKK